MSVEQAKASKVLDIEGTLARFGGDEELFREMASMLLEDAPRVAQQLKAAVLARDAVAIQMKAHALKGLVVGCGGVRAALSAQKLEDAGKDRRLVHTAQQLSELELELCQFIEAIRPYGAPRCQVDGI
jgi:HPt (histidine-containing phosphotransfer) domain-containing protein